MVSVLSRSKIQSRTCAKSALFPGTMGEGIWLIFEPWRLAFIHASRVNHGCLAVLKFPPSQSAWETDNAKSFERRDLAKGRGWASRSARGAEDSGRPRPRP